MDFIIQNLIPYLLLYKYVTVFVISFLAAFVVPIPSGNLLMIASGFSRVGYFNFYLVILISIVANILGDNLGYWMARIYGEKILSKIGFRRILNSKKFKKVEIQYSNHPGFIIFISRFEVLSTLSINLLSGISKTPYKKYLMHESVGSIAQVCVYGSIGYFFYYGWQSADSVIGKVSLIIGLITIILVIVFGKKFLIEKINKR